MKKNFSVFVATSIFPMLALAGCASNKNSTNTYDSGSNPGSIAIDSSGNVRVANNGNNNVTELMGVAKDPEYFPYTGPQWP